MAWFNINILYIFLPPSREREHTKACDSLSLYMKLEITEGLGSMCNAVLTNTVECVMADVDELGRTVCCLARACISLARGFSYWECRTRPEQGALRSTKWDLVDLWVEVEVEVDVFSLNKINKSQGA